MWCAPPCLPSAKPLTCSPRGRLIVNHFRSWTCISRLGLKMARWCGSPRRCLIAQPLRWGMFWAKRTLTTKRALRWLSPVSLKWIERCKSLWRSRLYLELACGTSWLPTFFLKFTSGVATSGQVSIIFAFNESAILGRYGANHVRGPSLVGSDDSGRVDELGRRAQCRPACPSDRRVIE